MTDQFSDRIVRLLASGARPKSPPVNILADHLHKRGRLAWGSGMLWGRLSDGGFMCLPSLIPEADKISAELQ